LSSLLLLPRVDDDVGVAVGARNPMSSTAPTVLKKRRRFSSSTSVRCSSWLRMSTIDRFRVILLPLPCRSSSSRRRGRPACGDMLHCRCSCRASWELLILAFSTAAVSVLLGLSPGPNLVFLSWAFEYPLGPPPSSGGGWASSSFPEA